MIMIFQCLRRKSGFISFVSGLRSHYHKMEHSRFKRYFTNPWKEGTVGSETDFTLDADTGVTRIKEMINLISSKRPAVTKDGEGGLYVGIGGIAYMYYYLSQSPLFASEKDQFIEKGLEYVRAAFLYTHQSVPVKQAEECAFLLGPAGIYATAAALHHAKGSPLEAEQFCQLYVSLSSICTPVDFLACGGDELLVGRAGFLCGALWLEKVFGSPVVPISDLHKVCQTIIISGRCYAQRTKSQCPLMYAYYGTEYLGAAHGLSGILQMLLSVPGFIQSDASIERDVRTSIDYILSTQSAEGNFPFATEEVRFKTRQPEDEMVHWCHGAPGVVYLMAKAYILWQEDRYLQSCIRCADIVWDKGLLKKGPGICHGVAGNAYVFLTLYRLTQDEMYLDKARQFASFLFCEEFLTCSRSPDSPFSLFEGIAGTACFINDVLQPSSASFPFMNIF
ncbi:lanC-like protein 3 isoform X1 [Thrips palmi]|uniref:LanC-like protein 3 homolog n=2 Tax=Thrips palmi TaxID=161013 RepID=A0A6P8YEN4_THRPL|nr:lanC-like protein 3 isoform X1 [Thrips palmi]